MGTLEQTVEWCISCCSQHEAWETCPGVVELAGPEETSRRFIARRDDVQESYQTLVAPAGELWRARIVTLPNRLWSVPGGRGTAKFYDTEATEAERKAVLFLFNRCRSMGLEITELAAELSCNTDDTVAGRRTGGKRHEQLLPALFGAGRPTWPARISNISIGGLFLATKRPERLGQRVNVTMRFQHYSIPLAGTVAWINPRSTGDLPAGMGIELDNPPFVYRQYVATLEDEDTAD